MAFRPRWDYVQVVFPRARTGSNDMLPPRLKSQLSCVDWEIRRLATTHTLGLHHVFKSTGPRKVGVVSESTLKISSKVVFTWEPIPGDA